MTYADGSSTIFTYDPEDNLILVIDSLSGRIFFKYDNRNRLLKETTAQGSIKYGYDSIGRQITMTVEGQEPVTYEYDATSKLLQVAQGSELIDIAYDAVGRRTSLTYPNSTSATYSYDASSRLSNLVHQGPNGPIEEVSYTYDAVGNFVSVNRANVVNPNLPQEIQAAYDVANQQIQFNSATPNFTYDENGNLKSQTNTTNSVTYTWDARNRLVAIEEQGISAIFAYDPFGRRIRKTINGATEEYLYDDKDVVAEFKGGTIAVRYLRSLNVDEPFIRFSDSGTEFYHSDVLGSTLSLTDLSGLVSTTYKYGPFGNTFVIGRSTNTIQYTGRENDETGLYYYRARYYSPAHARFLSQDPILAPLTPLSIGLSPKTNSVTWLLPSRLLNASGGEETSILNAYTYVQNNPLRFTDSIGLEKKKPDCDQATKNCTEALREDGYDGKNGNVADCYEAGMQTAARYGEGLNPAKHNSNFTKCSQGSTYQMNRFTDPSDGFLPIRPTPSPCRDQNFQKGCK